MTKALLQAKAEALEALVELHKDSQVGTGIKASALLLARDYRTLAASAPTVGEREAFEAWAVTEKLNIEWADAHLFFPATYTHYDTRDAWKVWQAARASASPAATQATQEAPEGMRTLHCGDSFCPQCGHNRDASSVSTIDLADGRKECQKCGTKWRENDLLVTPSAAGNAPAEAAGAEGLALVPIRATPAMQRVMGEEDWEWADLLAVAGSITSDQYDESLAVPPAPQIAPPVPAEVVNDSRRLQFLIDRKMVQNWILDDGGAKATELRAAGALFAEGSIADLRATIDALLAQYPKSKE